MAQKRSKCALLLCIAHIYSLSRDEAIRPVRYLGSYSVKVLVGFYEHHVYHTIIA